MEKDEGEVRLETNREVMAKIWGAIPKDPNFPKKEMVRYTRDDLWYLYEFGFVDERAYTYEDWVKAFDEFKQPDGTFLFDKEQFIKLGRYKYTGQIKAPLDPLKIREGWYDLDTWRRFFINSIMPNSHNLTLDIYKQGEEKAIELGLIVNNRIKIGKEEKLWIKQILDNFPSPRRRRELDVKEAYDRIAKAASDRSSKPISERSTFERGSKAGDSQKRDLDEALLKRSKVTAAARDVKTVSLKDMRRKGTTKSKRTNV